MKEKVLEKTVVLRLEIGEDIVSCVKDVCTRRRIKAAHISGIGALKRLFSAYITRKHRCISQMNITNLWSLQTFAAMQA